MVATACVSSNIDKKKPKRQTNSTQSKGTAMDRKEKKRITDALAKTNVCYVLITCAEPTEDGNMQVEMTYEGDAALASYLLQGAQICMDEQDTEETGVCCQSKILSIS